MILDSDKLTINTVHHGGKDRFPLGNSFLELINLALFT